MKSSSERKSSPWRTSRTRIVPLGAGPHDPVRVAARTSSFSFRDQNLPIPVIADSLNVAHVLEGSVRKAGDQVRITAQLIRAEDGFHVWSDTWDRTLEDVFAVQDEIAADVVDRLQVTLLEATPPVEETDPEAYPFLGQALVRAGEHESGLAALIEHDERHVAFNVAYVVAHRGEVDRAFEWLDRAVAYEDPGLSEIFLFPEFDALEDDPRWPAFLERIGMAREDLEVIEFGVDLPEERGRGATTS